MGQKKVVQKKRAPHLSQPHSMGQKQVAQKKRAPLGDPPSPAPSSSSEEQLTGGQEQEEEENHNEDPPEESPESESSEEEEEALEKVRKTQPSVKKKPITPTKALHPQPSDSDSGSDSETHLGSPRASGLTIKKTKPVSPKKPTSAKRVRPEFQENANETRKKKKAKKVVDAEKQKKSVGAINRLWSEKDEVLILKGLIGIQSPDTGKFGDMGEFHELIKESLSVNASKNKFLGKIGKLRTKFIKNDKRGGKAVLSTLHEQECFELSKSIWGGGQKEDTGVDGKGKNVNPRSARKTVKQLGKKWQNLLADEDALHLRREKLIKEEEKKWQKLRADEVAFHLRREELIKEQTKLMLDAIKASKD